MKAAVTVITTARPSGVNVGLIGNWRNYPLNVIKHNQFNYNDLVWSKLPDVFDLNHPLAIVAWAQPVESVQLSFLNTFFVLDVSQENCTANTVIFDTQRGLLKTDKTSRRCLQAVWLRADFGLKQDIERLALYLNQTQRKLPFIKGDVRLLPLGAVTRASTSWLGAHQLTDQLALPARRTELVFCRRIHLKTPVNFKMLMGQLERAQALQMLLLAERAGEHPFYFEQPVVMTQPIFSRELARDRFRQFAIDLMLQTQHPTTAQDIEGYLNSYFGK
ncbi:hypothetical protein [Lactobacillus sp. CBA3606]|uniref:hypothetical protein n=1 Tax=Lactobacillus sp. CBA3606 TaxID=2099789 RepID=UPI00131A1431|nr:hypothetical protein [Lactobacillus sp. CBA3606]